MLPNDIKKILYGTSLEKIARTDKYEVMTHWDKARELILE